jgi:integrase
MEMITRKLDGVYSANDDMCPDAFIYDPLHPQAPAADFVISRNVDGSVLSTYGSDIIDLSPYSTIAYGSKSKIDLNEIDQEYRDEARWLWFLNYVHGVGRSDNSLNPSTLYTRFNAAIKPLCDFAAEHGVTAQDILCDEQLLSVLVHRHQGSHRFCSSMSAMLGFYHYRGQNICGFEVAWGKQLQDFMSARCKWFASQKKQHPVIPPRIYQRLHQQAWAAVGTFEDYSAGIEKLIRYLVAEPNTDADKRSYQQRNKQLAQYIKRVGLANLAEQYHWGHNRNEIRAWLSFIQQVCKQLIHFYSGMRDNEANGLKYHCVERDDTKKRKRARLLGNTTKYVGSKKMAKWATSSEIERVIGVLQTIARPIASVLDVNLARRHKKGKAPCPLLLSLGYINRESSRDKHGTPLVQRWHDTTLTNNPLIDSTQFIITDEDLAFLEKIDPTRDWRDPDGSFAEGKVWHFTSHQFRRSLAVYAAQSGLVQIGSLQNQLKHLLREVTFYYANGAENAKGVFDFSDRDHMAKVYQDNKPLADFTAYIFQVLFNPETLLGINGRRVERTAKANTPEKQRQVLNDRATTIRQFKKGMRAYKETALGGCETTSPCDKKLTRSLVACIDCEQADIVPSKLNRMIDRLTIYTSKLQPDSIEQQSSEDDLIILKAFREKEVD